MSDKVPHDDDTSVWLYHTDLVHSGQAAEEGSPLREGLHYVQVLSMGEDGIWIRFRNTESLVGWKLYVPRERIVSIMMPDKEWPDE